MGDFCVHNRAHFGGGIHDVEPLALDHLQRNRGRAVVARGADGVFERQVDLRQITECYDTVAVGFDRQVIDVFGGIEGGRDFDRERALVGFYRARWHQKVVVGYDVDQLTSGDVIGLKGEGVDNDLQHFIAVTGKPHFEDRTHAFQFGLEVLGQPQQGAFRHRTREADDQDGELGEIDLRDFVLLTTLREFRLGLVHLVAHIGDGRAFVPAEFELKEDARKTLRCGGRHAL